MPQIPITAALIPSRPLDKWAVPRAGPSSAEACLGSPRTAASPFPVQKWGVVLGPHAEQSLETKLEPGWVGHSPGARALKNLVLGVDRGLQTQQS